MLVQLSIGKWEKKNSTCPIWPHPASLHLKFQTLCVSPSLSDCLGSVYGLKCPSHILQCSGMSGVNMMPDYWAWKGLSTPLDGAPGNPSATSPHSKTRPIIHGPRWPLHTLMLEWFPQALDTNIVEAGYQADWCGGWNNDLGIRGMNVCCGVLTSCMTLSKAQSFRSYLSLYNRKDTRGVTICQHQHVLGIWLMLVESAFYLLIIALDSPYHWAVIFKGE